MQASFDMEPLSAFESLAHSDERVHKLAALSLAVDAAREAWLMYRGEELAEDERLHAEWRRLRDEFKRELAECWPLLHASEYMPDYPARGGE